MKVEIISSDIGTEDLQQKVNAFLYDGIIIISQTFTATPMHDKYYDGNVCNQWVNYTMVINYKA